MYQNLGRGYIFCMFSTSILNIVTFFYRGFIFHFNFSSLDITPQVFCQEEAPPGGAADHSDGLSEDGGALPEGLPRPSWSSFYTEAIACL